MAYAEKKTLKGGKVVYYPVYIGPDGRRRTAGSFTSKRDAETDLRRARHHGQTDKAVSS